MIKPSLHVSNVSCSLNIQLKKHVEKMHQSCMKYQCEECEFATDFVANVWVHTLDEHPEKCLRFKEIKLSTQL